MKKRFNISEEKINVIIMDAVHKKMTNACDNVKKENVFLVRCIKPPNINIF